MSAAYIWLSDHCCCCCWIKALNMLRDKILESTKPYAYIDLINYTGLIHCAYTRYDDDDDDEWVSKQVENAIHNKTQVLRRCVHASGVSKNPPVCDEIVLYHQKYYIFLSKRKLTTQHKKTNKRIGQQTHPHAHSTFSKGETGNGGRYGLDRWIAKKMRQNKGQERVLDRAAAAAAEVKWRKVQIEIVEWMRIFTSFRSVRSFTNSPSQFHIPQMLRESDAMVCVSHTSTSPSYRIVVAR